MCSTNLKQLAFTYDVCEPHSNQKNIYIYIYSKWANENEKEFKYNTKES